MWFRTALCGLFLTAAAQAQDTIANTTFDGEVEAVATGLDRPWSIAFLPDGDMLVTERSGQLRLIADGQLQPVPVTGLPDIPMTRQGGLLDVVLHPDFAANGVVYLTHASGRRNDSRLSVTRARYDDGALSDVETIFTTNIGNDTGGHYGGRLAFLPDGSFVVTFGEGFDYREQAQDPSDHFGTTIRLNADGSIPDDNPAIDGAAPGVYSWGHRNPQAILYDAESGRLYAHEHGPRGGDEINIIEPGVNYGWPIATYGVDYSGAIISPYESYEGTRQPLLYWDPSIAPAGMTLYRGEMFPEWDGDLLVAALISGNAETRSGHLRVVDLDESGQPVGETVFLGERGSRVRDVRTAPDGSVYVLTDQGAVLRLSR
ncbi:PQQ-dependent sugar dehydrogenase [Hyphobacterium sp.]|uniref:PQQ-dependent sugar dehydrogenase n=1 Tax=Hyphobacterium sp. TaxID=2004662 RepID=UPI003B5221B6